MNNKLISIEKINNAAIQLVNSMSIDFIHPLFPRTKDCIEELIEKESQWEDSDNQIPFLPLNRLNSEQEKAKGLQILQEIIESGQFTSGKYVKEIEEILGGVYDAYCVGSSSGTDALIISLLSLGVGKDDEVIIPLNSFAATENAIFAVGAKPIYVNIDMSYNMQYADIETMISEKTKVIMPVCLYGSIMNIKEVYDIAKKYDLHLIIDAAQCFGIPQIINYADILVLSFNPFKNIGTFGKSGALLTRSEDVQKLARMYSYHGFEYNKKNIKLLNWGYNCRIDNIQAAILKEKLTFFELNALKRCYLAHRYISKLHQLEVKKKISLPIERLNNTWHLFPLYLIENTGRDLISYAKAKGFEFEIYYPVLSNQYNTDYVAKYCKDLDFSKSENIHMHTVHIPLHNHMSIKEQDKILKLLYDYFDK